MRNRGKRRVLCIKPQPDHYLENTKPFRATLMDIVLCKSLKTAKMMVSTVVSTVCINHLLKCQACLLAYIFNETDKLDIYHYKTDHEKVDFVRLRRQSWSNIEHVGIICCFDRENTKRVFAHILLLLG